MSHGITSTDRMIYTGAMPWHGLGTAMPEHCTARQALERADLNWPVHLHDVYAYYGEHERPMWTRIDGKRAIIREGAPEAFGIVSDDYVPFQNSDLADLIDAVAGPDAAAVETAGSLHGGRRVWMALRTSQFDIGGVDPVNTYALFATGHDGKTGIRVLPTPVRVVCWNTFRASGATGTAGLSIAHRGDLRASISAARDVLTGKVPAAIDAWRSTATNLASIQVGGSAFMAQLWNRIYWKAIATADAKRALSDAERLDQGRTDREADRIRDRAHRAVTRAATVAADMQCNFDRLDGGHHMPGKVRGTAWHALNAATHWMDHDRTASSPDARLERSTLLGDGAQAKEAATYAVLAAVR